MTNVSKRRKDFSKSGYKMMNDHNEFLQRITKSLYYGKLPSIPCLSLPVTELSAELFSEAQKGKSLKRLHVDDAAELTRNACVSPCSLVLALLYLERLKSTNPDYVTRMAPSELFLVSLMVSNKFLQDDGEEDEVFSDEWAASAGITSEALHKLERNFLHAIDWRIFVSDQRFETALEWLEHQVAMRQTRTRGWFTYSDLSNISNSIECFSLMKCLATVYLALSVSYLASITTLLASSLIVSHTSLVILNSPEILRIFDSNIVIPNKVSINLTNSEMNEEIAAANKILKFEENLKMTTPVSIGTQNNFENYFNSRPKLTNDNATLSSVLWQCSNKKIITDLFKRIVNHEYLNYILKMVKDNLFIYGGIVDSNNMKNILSISKNWLTHWNYKENQYYSIVGRFPGTVSLIC